MRGLVVSCLTSGSGHSFLHYFPSQHTPSSHCTPLPPSPHTPLLLSQGEPGIPGVAVGPRGKTGRKVRTLGCSPTLLPFCVARINRAFQLPCCAVGISLTASCTSPPSPSLPMYSLPPSPSPPMYSLPSSSPSPAPSLPSLCWLTQGQKGLPGDVGRPGWPGDDVSTTHIYPSPCQPVISIILLYPRDYLVPRDPGGQKEQRENLVHQEELVCQECQVHG